MPVSSSVVPVAGGDPLPHPRPAVDRLPPRLRRSPSQDVELGAGPRGRTPWKMIAQLSSSRWTRSAWPVFLHRGARAPRGEQRVPGQGSNGPLGDVPRAIVTACPRSCRLGDQDLPVVVDAVEVRPSGTCRPCPATTAHARSSTRPFSGSTACCTRPAGLRGRAGVAHEQVPSSSGEVGVDARTWSSRTGSDHGPSGSSACTAAATRRRRGLVVIIQNRPSWWRSVGAVMPPDPGAEETSQLGRSVEHVADLVPRAQVVRAEEGARRTRSSSTPSSTCRRRGTRSVGVESRDHRTTGAQLEGRWVGRGARRRLGAGHPSHCVGVGRHRARVGCARPADGRGGAVGRTTSAGVPAGTTTRSSKARRRAARPTRSGRRAIRARPRPGEPATGARADPESPVARVLEQLDAGGVAVQEGDDRALGVVVERLVRHAVGVDAVPALPHGRGAAVDHRQPGRLAVLASSSS